MHVEKYLIVFLQRSPKSLSWISSADNRRKNFLWGALFFAKKVDNLLVVILNIQANLLNASSTSNVQPSAA